MREGNGLNNKIQILRAYLVGIHILCLAKNTYSPLSFQIYDMYDTHLDYVFKNYFQIMRSKFENNFMFFLSKI